MASDFISRCAWVVMGPDPALATCLRCEDVAAPPTKAVPFAALEAFVNGFAAEHSACPGEEESEKSKVESGPVPVEPGEEPVRQVEDELSAPPWLAEKSTARRVASGAVFIDCRVHGTRPATIVGSRAVCGLVDEAHLKCSESAPAPAAATKQGGR